MAEQKIFAKISEVAKKIKPISKDNNSGQGYKFRGIDDAMNAIGPVMAEHGIFFTTEKIEDILAADVKSKNGGAGYRLLKRFTFKLYADDGSSITTSADGEAIDYGDKASNKAHSVAYREAMFKIFCVPFENSGNDTEPDSHDLVSDNQQPAVNQEPAKQAPNIDKLRADIATVTEKAHWDEWEAYVNKNFNGEPLKQLLNDLEAVYKLKGFK